MFILRRQRDNRLDGLLCAPHLYRFTSYNFAAILRPLERKRDVVGHGSQLSPATHLRIATSDTL
jgi:hypothetical protein